MGKVVPDITRIFHDLDGSSLILGDFNLHHQFWGSPVASRASEIFVDWLVDSSFCILNSVAPMHVAPSGICSLIDLSLCSSDLLASTSFQVEDDTYDSDHRPPLQPGITMYKWPLICREVNNTLQHLSEINYDIFYNLVLSTMNKYSFSRHSPAKGILV